MTEPQAPPNADSLYRTHVHLVGRWAARLGGPALDLEDTVHEVFTIACARLASFRGDSTVATWLFGITDKVVRVGGRLGLGHVTYLVRARTETFHLICAVEKNSQSRPSAEVPAGKRSGIGRIIIER